MLLGNNKSCKVMRRGSIRFKMFDGVDRIFTNVRYVSELKRNLISLCVLDKLGYSFRADKGVLKVVKGSLVVIRSVR